MIMDAFEVMLRVGDTQTYPDGRLEFTPRVIAIRIVKPVPTLYITNVSEIKEQIYLAVNDVIKEVDLRLSEGRN